MEVRYCIAHRMQCFAHCLVFALAGLITELPLLDVISSGGAASINLMHYTRACTSGVNLCA